MHSIESRFVTGPSNILFAGVYVSIFQPGNFTGWDSEGVKVVVIVINQTARDVCSRQIYCCPSLCFVSLGMALDLGKRSQARQFVIRLVGRLSMTSQYLRTTPRAAL